MQKKKSIHNKGKELKLKCVRKRNGASREGVEQKRNKGLQNILRQHREKTGSVT